jgi:Nucleotidyltransferase of unknown function (DUF6036)
VNQDFKDLLRAFNDEKVRYLIVGGYALIKYTEPRYTKDLDIWVSPDLENAQRVFRALEKYGAPVSQMSAEDFSREGFFFTMGFAPNRVDILFDLAGLRFPAAWERRELAKIGDVETNFLSRSDLIINKEAVGRKQDLADVERLRIAAIRDSRK